MASGSPDWSPRIISSGSGSEKLNVSVTDSDSSGSFSHVVKSILIYNRGSFDVYFNPDATATTDDFPVPHGSWCSVDVPVTTPHFICASGETSEVRCIGVY